MPSNKGTKWFLAGAKNETDIYKHYKKSNDTPVDRKTFMRVLNAINIEFIRMIVEEGKEIRMPYLSTLSIRKTKNSKTKAFDYNHFNLTGEKVYIENEHSDGYRAKFHWKKSGCKVPGKTVYAFKPARDNSRALAKEMKKFNGHSKYIESNGK